MSSQFGRNPQERLARLRCAAGHGHDVDFRVPEPDLPDGLDAFPTRHEQVHNRDACREGAQGLKCCVTVRRLAHRMAKGSEHLAQEESESLIIVGNQYLRHGMIGCAVVRRVIGGPPQNLSAPLRRHSRITATCR